MGHADLPAREIRDPELAENASFVVERGNAAVALADPEHLGTALDALIENAVKQTEPGDEIRLGARREGGRVAVWVADSGPGIAPEQLEAIFDRFARLDVGRSRDRGGVGLAIVKAIAEAHGGSVRVRSALGRGSVFEVLLPAPLAPLEAAAR